MDNKERNASEKADELIGKARDVSEKASVFGEVLVGVGRILPGGIGKPITDIGMTMKRMEQNVSRVENKKKEFDEKVANREVDSLETPHADPSEVDENEISKTLPGSDHDRGMERS